MKRPIYGYMVYMAIWVKLWLGKNKWIRLLPHCPPVERIAGRVTTVHGPHPPAAERETGLQSPLSRCCVHTPRAPILFTDSVPRIHFNLL